MRNAANLEYIYCNLFVRVAATWALHVGAARPLPLPGRSAARRGRSDGRGRYSCLSNAAASFPPLVRGRVATAARPCLGLATLEEPTCFATWRGTVRAPPLEPFEGSRDRAGSPHITHARPHYLGARVGALRRRPVRLFGRWVDEKTGGKRLKVTPRQLTEPCTTLPASTCQCTMYPRRHRRAWTAR